MQVVGYDTRRDLIRRGPLLDRDGRVWAVEGANGTGRPLAQRLVEAGERVLAVASGEATKSEQHGYGQNEFVPWQLGAVM